MKICKDKKIFLLLLVWSAVVLLLMSPDSPIHGPWNHLDSAWFFMSGKALMNGMIPYVEFADSKGPLLWLIYGIGYLLSPRSYTGMYVLAVFCYAGIFYYNFKTARIFLKDDRRSLIVTLLMAIPYFLYWFHYEVRAEDFSTLPVAISMYYLFHLLYSNEESRNSMRLTGLVLGSCFMVLVMIKYNIAAMQGLMIALTVLYYIWKKSEYGILKWLLAGMAPIALPIVVYLFLTDSLSAFFHEYFFNTIQTVLDESNYNKTYSEELKSVFDEPKNQALFFIIVLGGWMLGRLQERWRYVPLLLGVAFFVLSTRHNLGYYYCICNIFVLYLLTATAYTFTDAIKGRSVAIAAITVIIWGVGENLRKESDLYNISIWNHNEERQVYEDISQILASEPKARIMYIFAGEWGHGLAGECLPAGRYWVYQFGSTAEMEREHVELMKSGEADFVIAYESEKSNAKGWTQENIEACGYEVCYLKKHICYMFGATTSIVYRKTRNQERIRRD